MTTSYIKETTYNNKEYITTNIKDSIYATEYITYNERLTTDYKEETTWKKEYTTWSKLDTSWNKEYKTLTTNNICYLACLNCDEGPIIDSNTGNIISQNCLNCNEGYYLKSGTKNCYNNETIEPGHYLDINIFPNVWKECYKKCSTCETLGNSTNMNCLSCNLNLINAQTMKSFILTENGNCIEECKDNLFLTLSGECVSECPQGTFQFSLNQTCLQFCPNNYEINNEQDKCILKTFDQTTSSTEFKSQITKNITNYLNSSTLINGSDFIAVIFSSDNLDPKEQLKKGISAIDLGNCTQTLKEHYNISNEESLIILNMESKRNESKEEDKNDNDKSFDLGKNVQVEVYDMSGRKLDLSVCKENIKVMKYIGDVEELNIDSAMSLGEKGIDVFNASDEFFNDICHNYNNTDGIDIIIKDRRTDIYQNVSFCQDGCTYTGMDYELMTANCICDSSILQNELNNNTKKENSKEEELSFNSMKDSLLKSLFPFNLDVIHCYNLVINLKILKNNIGFYFMFVMFILQIIFFIIYLFKKLEPLRYFMLIFKKKNADNIKAFPPPKNNKINKKENKKSDDAKQNNCIKSKFVPNNKNKKSNLKKKDLKNNIVIEDEPNNKKKFIVKKKIKFMDEENNNFDIFLNNQKNDFLNPNPSSSCTKINDGKNSIFSQKEIRQNIFTNNFTPIINIQTPILNINNKKKTKELKSEPENNKNKILKKKPKVKKPLNENRFIKKYSANKSYLSKGNKSSNSKALINIETTGNKKEENIKDLNEQDLIRLSKTDEDLQEMDYEQAIIQDKRSYLRMYWAFLVDTQIILGTFCTENYLNLMVIKLSFFVCTFQISFFLNAFFYVDEYISDAYHNDGALDFISGLPKAIYSLIATVITTNLLKMLSNSKSELMKLIREKRKNNNYISLINIKLEKLKKKLIVYFIFVFLLGLFFLYYVSSFCAVYRYSQKYWFIGCLESFGMDSLVAIIVCIFLSFFRYIAIKNHLKCFYVLANIIGTFL